VRFRLVKETHRHGKKLTRELILHFDGTDPVFGSVFVSVRDLGGAHLQNGDGQGLFPFLRLNVGQLSPGQDLDLTLVFTHAGKATNPSLEVFAGSLPL
jgi:hypothetical protein